MSWACNLFFSLKLPYLPSLFTSCFHPYNHLFCFFQYRSNSLCLLFSCIMYATFGCIKTVCFLFLFHVLGSIIASSPHLLRPLSALSKLQNYISPCHGSGVSCRPLTTGTRLRSQGSQYRVGISCGYDSTMTSFSPNSSIFPWQYYSTSALFVLISYNKSQRDALFLRFIGKELRVSGRSTVHHQESQHCINSNRYLSC